MAISAIIFTWRDDQSTKSLIESANHFTTAEHIANLPYKQVEEKKQNYTKYHQGTYSRLDAG